LAATNTHSESHFSETKKSGLMGTGGVGFTVGQKMNSTDMDSK
jgi:filamentous hemagglutinin